MPESMANPCSVNAYGNLKYKFGTNIISSLDQAEPLGGLRLTTISFETIKVSLFSDDINQIEIHVTRLDGKFHIRTFGLLLIIFEEIRESILLIIVECT